MSLASERSMPVIDIAHNADGWYSLPAPDGPVWVPDERAALEVARHLWPGTAFRIVPWVSGNPSLADQTLWADVLPSRDAADPGQSAASPAALTEAELRAQWGDR